MTADAAQETTTSRATRAKQNDERGTTSEVWRIQECTAVYPTNAFGTLEFQGEYSHTTKAEVKFNTLQINHQFISHLT